MCTEFPTKLLTKAGFFSSTSDNCLNFIHLLELCKESVEVGWQKFGFAESFKPSIDDFSDNILRLDGNNISAEEFITRYEANYIPCVIKNLQNSWPANESWTLKVIFGSIFISLIILFIVAWLDKLCCFCCRNLLANIATRNLSVVKMMMAILSS